MKEARRLLLVNPNDVADVVRDIGEPWLIPQTFLAVVLVPPLRDCRSAQRGKLVIVDALGFGIGFGIGFGFGFGVRVRVRVSIHTQKCYISREREITATT